MGTVNYLPGTNRRFAEMPCAHAPAHTPPGRAPCGTAAAKSSTIAPAHVSNNLMSSLHLLPWPKHCPSAQWWDSMCASGTTMTGHKLVHTVETWRNILHGTFCSWFSLKSPSPMYRADTSPSPLHTVVQFDPRKKTFGSGSATSIPLTSRLAVIVAVRLHLYLKGTRTPHMVTNQT